MMAGAASCRASAAAMLVVVVMCAGVAAAAVYEVGDKAGWTVMGNPNYGAWAASKKFHLGDTVVFTYLKQFHNVMAVSRAGYKNCDASKPIATWSTGNDSVVVNTTGHHYFLCGYPGHCAAGQKVDINVLSSSSSSAAPSVAPSPAAGTEPSAAASGSAAPSPHGNAAPAGTTVAAGSVVAASVLCLVAAVAVLA